ncbi:hypothetical protein D3C81_1363350 [compost metagenome]
MQVVAGQGVQRGPRLHQRQQRRQQRDHQQAAQQRQAAGQQQALAQHLAQRAAVAAATGLGGETGGAHAQEAEGPHQQAVQAAADRHRGKLVGVRQVADHRAVDQRHQWHRQVGEDHRPGQRPHPALGWTMLPGVAQAAHSARSVLQKMVEAAGLSCTPKRSTRVAVITDASRPTTRRR